MCHGPLGSGHQLVASTLGQSGQGHDQRGLEEIKKAKSLHPKNDRERNYIAAIDTFYSSSKKRDHDAGADAYTRAMEQMYQRYPDDREAAAFSALSLLASEPHHDSTFANRKK